MCIEVIFRLAKHYTKDYGTKTSQKIDLYGMTVQSALVQFIKNKLAHFKDRMNINWQPFRDTKLNNRDVELLFTMNLDAIDQIYLKYSKMNKDTQWKAFNEEHLCYIDCEQMLMRDSILHISRATVREAFAMCKMTVINEQS